MAVKSFLGRPTNKFSNWDRMHRNKSEAEELETQLILNFSFIAKPNFGSATINESVLLT